MRLIINATNLQSGGALQVASELLGAWSRDYPQHEYFVLLSPQLQQLQQGSYPVGFRFFTFGHNPTSSLWSAITFQRRLAALERSISPDLVFTLFGPGLWRPAATHYCGFANGYYLFDDAPYIRNHIKDNLLKRAFYYCRRYVLLRQLRREADVLWLETEAAEQKLATEWGDRMPVTIIAGNTYGSSMIPAEQNKADDLFTFLYLTAYYPHKNLEILVPVVAQLHQAGVRCRILLTLPEAIFERIFGGKDPGAYLVNYGPVRPGELNTVYAQADAVLLPTLLETFSASYPEAMYMGKPVLTSQLPFATAVCGDAALYFDPLSTGDIADRMQQLMHDPALYADLVAKGREQLKTMETPASRAGKLMQCMQDIVDGKIHTHVRDNRDH